MQTYLRFAIGVAVVLMLTGTALAAPAAVSGIQALHQGDTIRIRWSPVEGAHHYRVYWASQSILSNDGMIDDYEDTTGDETTLEMQAPPAGARPFYSVMAVDADGTESEVFLEESQLTEMPAVDAPALATEGEQIAEPTPVAEPEPMPEPIVEPVAPPVAAPTEAPVLAEPTASSSSEAASSLPTVPASVEIQNVTVPSNKQVKIRFSMPVRLESDAAMQTFKISDRSGKILRIFNALIVGAELTLSTEEHDTGALYRLNIAGEGLKGADGQSLDDSSRSTFFLGYGSDVAADVANPVANDAVAIRTPQDISGLTATVLPDNAGKYTVQLNWRGQEVSGGLGGFFVRQTFDGGVSLSESLPLPSDAAGVQIPGVSAGQFGAVVQTRNLHNFTSKGVFINVEVPSGRVIGTVLPFTVSAAPTAQVSDTVISGESEESSSSSSVSSAQSSSKESALKPIQVTKAADGNDLSGTGLPLAGFAVTSMGAMLGWKRARRML